MTARETIRHRVAVAGRVVDERTRRGVAGAEVRLSGGTRSGQVRTAADGHFHFLDLPDGSYALEAALPSLGDRYGGASARVDVSRDAEGNVVIPRVELVLRPTTVIGRVSSAAAAGSVAVGMAEVRVKGSGERTLEVVRDGYETASASAALDEPGTVKTLDFVLVSSGR